MQPGFIISAGDEQMNGAKELLACQKYFKKSKYPISNDSAEVYRFYCPKADIHLDISKRVMEFACYDADGMIGIQIRRVCAAQCRYYQEMVRKSKFIVLK